ncbi:MAG TPA: MerR family transcriptional regulator [Dermatophilaceae bacterium]|nr:MerR family transcriptional regulator [Dermatophilaceae bacterium]
MTDTTRLDPRLTVGQVARRLGVTRRTLRHYDEIDLVAPGARSAAGYRLYTADDLAQLQNVVVYRRLGFTLEEIRDLLSQPGDLEHHLRRQRAAVTAHLDRLRELVEAIDTALEHTMTERPITDKERKALFGDSFDDDWAVEAERRWGETDQWKQSQSRTTHFTTRDWQLVTQVGDAVEADFVTALTGGEPADGPVAMAVAERHRESVQTFYECPPGFHVKLAEMYLTDPRFTAHYEGRHPGLARYVHDAIQANAARAGASSG